MENHYVQNMALGPVLGYKNPIIMECYSSEKTDNKQSIKITV